MLKLAWSYLQDVTSKIEDAKVRILLDNIHFKFVCEVPGFKQSLFVFT